MTGDRWIATHQEHWPVYGRTEEEAETEAINAWYDGDVGTFWTDVSWGIATVREMK